MFTFEDNSVLSLGRDDRATIEWKIKPNLTRAHVPAPFELPKAIEISEEEEEDDNEPNIQNDIVATNPSKSLETIKLLGLSTSDQISAGYCGMGATASLGGASPLTIDMNDKRSMISCVGSYGKSITRCAISSNGKFMLLGEGVPKNAEDVDEETFIGGLSIVSAITSETSAKINRIYRCIYIQLYTSRQILSYLRLRYRIYKRNHTSVCLYMYIQARFVHTQ